MTTTFFSFFAFVSYRIIHVPEEYLHFLVIHPVCNNTVGDHDNGYNYEQNGNGDVIVDDAPEEDSLEDIVL